MTTQPQRDAERLSPASEFARLPPCRFCGAPLTRTFVDLGTSPLCESYLSHDQLNLMEPFYPLHVRICDRCLLVQLEEYVSPAQIFTDYAYFSSYSDTMVRHAQQYAEAIIPRFKLDAQSAVVEIASNDGYLLQHFLQRGMSVLGIDPARNIASAAIDRGIPTMAEFFGSDVARRLISQQAPADLIVANNVLAHVPDLNDFVRGLKVLLHQHGVITLEFPHLLRLIEGNQFDTIYHEHFSYFSFLVVQEIFSSHQLTIFDVEELPIHGGSLRICVRHSEDKSRLTSTRVSELAARETAVGMRDLEFYVPFRDRVNATKYKLLKLLIDLKRQGCSIVGYGAPGKGNTLLNYCGIRTDFLDYTVDRNPYKQGKFLPGTHIPIHDPEQITITRPDYILILPWNIKDEIISQLAHAKSWGARLIVPMPDVEIVP